MAKTYGQLQGEVASLLDRDDFNKVNPVTGENENLIDVWLLDAEAEAYDCAITRLPPYEFKYDVSLKAGETTLDVPNGYNEVKDITMTLGSGQKFVLERTSPDQLLSASEYNSQSYPDRFAYDYRSFIFPRSGSDVSLRIVYYGTLDSIDTITTSVTKHWLLNNTGKWLRYMAALDGARYYRLNELITTFEQRADEIKDSIVGKWENQELSGTTPTNYNIYR